ncbi:MAG: C-terminal binding protein [Betaproteobacteria bacterium]|nr:C-terminal binding protein [Betaproteobacteria bacterium]
MPLTVLYPDSRNDPLDLERKVFNDDTVLINPRQKSFDAIDLNAWQTCDGIVVSRIPMNSSAIPHLKKCRVIVRNGVGYDNVDLELTGSAGIAVCNVPDYGTTEVADTAVAMMLAFARGTAIYDAALRQDPTANWTHTHNVTARRLRGATYGVIGMGRIGTASALRARAFGMNVVFYDPNLSIGAELSFGFTRAKTLDDLLKVSDVITIHAPLTKETHRMINAETVAKIKPGAYLISTARGPICDTAALLEGLKSNRLLAVGLDVLPSEPATLNDPLVKAWQANEPWLRGRVLMGPHAGFYSPDGLVDLRTKAAETARLYIKEGKLINCVNSEFLKNPR